MNRARLSCERRAGFLQELAMTVPCPTCGAHADQWCLSVLGDHTAPILHGTRTHGVAYAYEVGYGDAVYHAENPCQHNGQDWEPNDA